VRPSLKGEHLTGLFLESGSSLRTLGNASVVGSKARYYKGCKISMSELRAQVAEAVRARIIRKVKTRTNQKYLKMFRKQLENFLEQERRLKLGASITRFAVMLRKAMKKRQISSGKRLLKIRLESTGNEPRNERTNGYVNAT
jgi:hypothetical protein